MKSLSITVPNPCQENWHKMSPVNKGRFCSSCEKVVVDFTQMSDAELVDYLSHTKEATCGRFNHSQLNRPVIRHQPKKYGSLKWVASFLLWLSMHNLSEASGKNNPPSISTEQIYYAEADSIIKQGKEKEWNGIVRGYVKNKRDSTAIVAAAVYLEGTKIEVITNRDGYFELNVPENYRQNGLQLNITFIGFNKKVISIPSLKSPHKKQIIFLEEVSSDLIGDIVTIGYAIKKER